MRNLRSRLAILIVILIIWLFAAALPLVWGRMKREQGYHATLRSYSAELKPGMSRKQVEDYLEVKGVSFGQSCCINERSAFDDVVRIGEEKVYVPVCSREQVLLAFEFAAKEPQRWPKSYPSDELKRIVLWRPAECL